ncbi:hypothetical protein H2200_006878 [Cladophialophora chaetospira]|uniref:Uncharacterized protein n=1 Tax=Cladophialophora chaetospira TaxID=386627 RepID=A0AA38X9M7_9EURO|nr:hypothetical protein H2200_006878 [Cladophialophora chaetospira]
MAVKDTISTQLAAIFIHQTPTTPHPAELSGASTDPIKQLMGLPLELRNKIYKLLLVKEDWVGVVISHSQYGPPVLADYCDNYRVGPKHTTSILRVSQQAHSEGTDILYGVNKFSCHHFMGFITAFLEGNAITGGRHGIGEANAAKIKRTMFELPVKVVFNQDGDDHTLGEFLDSICRKLPALQSLCLTTTESYKDVPKNFEEGLSLEWIQHTHVGPLLKTAARVTQYHPLLRKAIWSRWNGFVGCMGGDRRWPTPKLAGQWVVDIVREGPLPVLKGETMARMSPFNTEFQGVDWVIDCLRVRRTSLEDTVAWYKAWKGHFALPNDATSSETNPEEVKHWTRPRRYHPSMGVDLTNHVMAIARKDEMVVDRAKAIPQLSQADGNDLPVNLGEILPAEGDDKDVGKKTLQHYPTRGWEYSAADTTEARSIATACRRRSSPTMAPPRLANKVCLITGTSGGMGRAAALHFAREGAKVVGCDINAEKDAETVKLVTAEGGSMISLSPCDLTKADSCQKLVDAVIEKHGRLDVLYNNAAVAYFAWIDNHPDDVWYKTIDYELHLVFLLTRAAWPHLKKSGKASIISTGSTSGFFTATALPALAHAAAKGAVIAMTKQLALEGRKHGIRANSISPGLVHTNATAAFLENPEWRASQVDKVMLGRPGQPEEIAATAVFLASDESSFITAANLVVDGGTTAW